MTTPQVTDEASLGHLLDQVVEAQKRYATFTQEQVDRIFIKVAQVASQNSLRLAQLAVDESQMGILEDKAIKNHFASEYIACKYRNTPTCDIIKQDDVDGTITIAEPLGVIAGIVPCTNPTSTVFFKTLLALKTRNGIVFSPHPRTKKCCFEAAKLLHDAAVNAGAPENIIACLEDPTIELSGALMKAPQIACVMATGGPAMVAAAYSSGHPAIGVGPGNVPAVIDEFADVRGAVSDVLSSKDFDHGLICASEQHIVAVDSVFDQICDQLKLRGAHILTPEETPLVEKVLFKDGTGPLDPTIVGLPAFEIARKAGVTVPSDCKCLVGLGSEVGTSPWSREKLSPTLGLFRVPDWESAVDLAQKLLCNGGRGHTAVLHTDEQRCRKRIEEFGRRLDACRLLVNMPAAHGAIGDMFNFRLPPSLMLGTGSYGNNQVSGNVGPRHLLNYKTLAIRRDTGQAFTAPGAIYYGDGAIKRAVPELLAEGFSSFFIICDTTEEESEVLTDLVVALGPSAKTLYHINKDDFSTSYHDVRDCVAKARKVGPDCFLAFGGASAMNAARVVRLVYELDCSEAELIDYCSSCLDGTKRVTPIPPLAMYSHSVLITVPACSGFGNDVSPMSHVNVNDTVYPISGFCLLPYATIVDDSLAHENVLDVALHGMTALAHSIEAYVSLAHTDPTDSLALYVIRSVTHLLPSCFLISQSLGRCTECNSKRLHHLYTLSSMALANTFLGITHALASAISVRWQIPYDMCSTVLLPHVIRFQATESPYKPTVHPKNPYPNQIERFAQIAEAIRIEGESPKEQVNGLIHHIQTMIEDAGCPRRFSDCLNTSQDAFESSLQEIAHSLWKQMAMGTSPVTPLIKDLIEIGKNAW